jgi:hypothetical protein
VKQSVPGSAAALVNKRWDLLAEIGDEIERERKRTGLATTLAMMDQLRSHLRTWAPTWPAEGDLEEDYETHRRVAEALARTTRSSSHPARRARRVR